MKYIKSINKVEGDILGLETYEISFDEETPWKNLKIRIKFDWEGLLTKEIFISNNSDLYKNYSIEIKLIN